MREMVCEKVKYCQICHEAFVGVVDVLCQNCKGREKKPIGRKSQKVNRITARLQELKEEIIAFEGLSEAEKDKAQIEGKAVFVENTIKEILDILIEVSKHE